MINLIFLQFVDFSSDDLSETDKIIQNIIVFALFSYPLFVVLESFFAKFFHRHFFIHTYLIKKKLSEDQQKILRDEFPFYQKLTPKGKSFFEHRVSVFIKKYTFHGKEDFEVTNEVKLIIAGTYSMLTFGMRNYTATVFNKIVIYPDIYLSTLSGDYHKGEFNPMVKTVAFSWSDFLVGHINNTNNLNLGIHEFVHVLHHQSNKSQELSFMIFSNLFDQIVAYMVKPKNLERVIKSNYFRVYAFTNNYELLAVMIEHFFETPEQFHNEFPELFKKVKRLINYNTKHFIE